MKIFCKILNLETNMRPQRGSLLIGRKLKIDFKQQMKIIKYVYTIIKK